MPPVSSRMMLKSTPRHTSALRGELSTRDGAAKLQGRRLPNVPISLRSLRIPCSGRTAPVPHFFVCVLVVAFALRWVDELTYGSADGTKENGVGVLSSGEGLVGQGGAGGIN